MEQIKNNKDEISNEKIDITELEGGPLWGKKKMITANYGNLLGFSQAETIMKMYNNFPDSLNFSPKLQLNASDCINFPLVYPELENFFPKLQEDLTKISVFEKHKNIKTNHLIIVTKCNNGKHALAYYERGKLKMATYISIGLNNHKTLCGKYELTHDSVFRRSRKYNNAPMPYSLHISGGYFLHQGESDGFPKSHGCVRTPGLYARRLYHYLPKTISKNETPIIILEDLY